MLDLLGEGVALFDADDRFVLWNRRYAQIYALSQACLRAGGSYRAFLQHGAEMGQYLSGQAGKPDWLAERLRPGPKPLQEHLPGDRWVRVREHAWNGGTVRVVTDTTGVRRNESSFKLLFEASPLPLSVVDAKTLQILAVNDAAVRYYGHSREAFLALRTPDLAPPHVRQSVDDIMTSDIGAYHGEEVWTHVSADGRLLRIRPYVRPLVYEGRQCLLAAAVDVGAAMDAEAELRQGLDRAASANRVHAEALSTLGDDLRAQLANLLQLSSALLAADLSPELRAIAEQVRAVGGAMDGELRELPTFR
jgi:PAS domain S-box-containing protein